MVFVNVHSAIDLACGIFTSPWESKNQAFSELFRDNRSLFCFTIQDALTSDQVLKNQTVLGTLLIISFMGTSQPLCIFPPALSVTRL